MSGTLAAFLRKRGLVSVQCGLLKNVNGPEKFDFINFESSARHVLDISRKPLSVEMVPERYCPIKTNRVSRPGLDNPY